MTGPALETRALAIGYKRRGRPDNIVARGLSLSLQRGQLIGLLGPNGIGKSTLLRTLAGMQPPLAGQILLEGAPIASFSPGALARRLSLVLTAAPQPNLMNGYALVALGRHPHTDWIGRLRHQDRAAIVRALAAVGAQDLAERPVAELSDGQRQKTNDRAGAGARKRDYAARRADRLSRPAPPCRNDAAPQADRA